MSEPSPNQERAERAAFEVGMGCAPVLLHGVPIESLSQGAVCALCARMMTECSRVGATRDAMRHIGLKKVPPRFAT